MRNKIGIILSCILVLCGVAGCGKTPDEEQKKLTPTPDAVITMTPAITDSEIPLTVAPSKTKELPIYTISGDLSEVVAITALIAESEEITEQIVTDAVVEGLADIAIYVKVNSVSRRNDVVVVDFDATTPPVSQVGASIEGLILDAFGQSLLDNIADCKGISFTVDGGNYASGHFEFDENDIYMRR